MHETTNYFLMNNKMSKTDNYIFIFFLLIIFLLNQFQLNSVPWFHHFDTDWFNAYNTLLILSGYPQEFIDHPALSLYIINSGILRIYDFFDPNISFNVDLILSVFNRMNTDFSPNSFK